MGLTNNSMGINTLDSKLEINFVIRKKNNTFALQN